MTDASKDLDPTDTTTLAEKATIDPTTVFDCPKDVVAADDLTKKEKVDVLTQWEADARALQTATDEGMPGEKRPHLDEVKSAQMLLAVNKKTWLQRGSLGKLLDFFR